MTKYRIRYLPILCKYDVQRYEEGNGWLTEGHGDIYEQLDERFDSWQEALNYINGLDPVRISTEPIIVEELER